LTGRFFMSAVDAFLRIDGVEGESHDAKHKNEIDVESWSWGETQSGSMASGGGGGAGKVCVQDFRFSMKANKASPKLMLACASGEHFKKAVLTCRKAGKGQQEYLRITLSELLVSSFTTGSSVSGGIIPTDTVTLNFRKLEYEYREQNPDGSLAAPAKAGWDVKANTRV
jgi:type VI secretion system secreted protein Hcp